MAERGTTGGEGATGIGEAEARNRLRDANEDLGLAVLPARQILRLLGRALTLHCPHCGGGPVRESWFRMRHDCAKCGRPLERGEQDYFLGAMMFNLVLSEMLFAAIFVAILVIMWPSVPWDGISIGAPLGMAAAPFLLYPVSKLVWLAFDLSFRPERES